MTKGRFVGKRNGLTRNMDCAVANIDTRTKAPVGRVILQKVSDRFGIGKLVNRRQRQGSARVFSLGYSARQKTPDPSEPVDTNACH